MGVGARFRAFARSSSPKKVGTIVVAFVGWILRLQRCCTVCTPVLVPVRTSYADHDFFVCGADRLRSSLSDWLTHESGYRAHALRIHDT